MLDALQYLHGKPIVSGLYKEQDSDFFVKEDLGYELEGEGEHVFVNVQKQNCNTLFVAEQLAKFAGISPKLVGYAGLKDRNAVTQQWFGLHIPGKFTPDFSTFELEGCKILAVKRHNKKLRIGNLKGNFFSLILRNIDNQTEVNDRLALIKAHGVPNYFGEQRFGKENNNIEQAILWAKGELKVKDRKKRSFYLSAARSAIFNHIVSERIVKKLNDTVLNGDILQFAERGSWFVAQADELALLQQRLESAELNITAPMLGDNGAQTKDDALRFEQQSIDDYWADFLPLFRQERVETARRSARLRAKNLDWQWQDKATLTLDFWLPAGSYATAVLRELIS
ncbi:TruD family tRNA pseudouridine synthase [Orbus hercynius]|uniref:tRNA pseudouridine synthase D n=1 Tax=Orbus hercynius TaxID=593135 RepID=A0A495RIF2_9GAMM|nr:tRNA pseudouridine(13) synthase TruD [Orbus hercynius]RKS87090.1 TruD family tRNA pseudouridine synthase [Orbus hercynius]